MNTQWFLGANTAEGFVSRFSELQADHRVKKSIILKGGAGCGKSTFMKKLQKTAEALGADTEVYPCSSDPASLDGLFIVPLGLAFFDGTAPHVLEPKLCCCDAVYLNLGCFYDADRVADHRETLFSLQKENQSHYPAAYAHLSAASALQRCARESMTDTDPDGLYRIIRALLGELPRASKGTGKCRELFLRAYTPFGEISFAENLRALCRTCVAIKDPCTVSAPLLSELCSRYQQAGYDCICLLSPLSSDRLEGLIVPEASTAFFASKLPVADASVTVQLDRYFPLSAAAGELLRQSEAHCQEAIAELRKAKDIHDKMEQVYRPFVSFEGLDLLTQEYRKKIKAGLLAGK